MSYIAPPKNFEITYHQYIIGIDDPTKEFSWPDNLVPFNQYLYDKLLTFSPSEFLFKISFSCGYDFM